MSRLLLALAITGCGPAITITRDGAISIPVAATYAWGAADSPRTRGERDPRVDNDSVRTRIERAVDLALEQRGFRKAPAASATLLVHYHVGVRNRVDTVATAIPRDVTGYQWGYWGEPERLLREVEYTQGRLMLDVLDRTTLRLAWRGVARDEVTAASASDKAIREVVARLFERFPDGK